MTVPEVGHALGETRWAGQHVADPPPLQFFGSKLCPARGVVGLDEVRRFGGRRLDEPVDGALEAIVHG